MFSGNHKRGVNFGNKKPVNADKVLKTAEKLRQQRDSERRRAKLIGYIQQRWRGRLMMAKARKELIEFITSFDGHGVLDSGVFAAVVPAFPDLDGNVVNCLFLKYKQFIKTKDRFLNFLQGRLLSLWTNKRLYDSVQVKIVPFVYATRSTTNKLETLSELKPFLANLRTRSALQYLVSCDPQVSFSACLLCKPDIMFYMDIEWFNSLFGPLAFSYCAEWLDSGVSELINEETLLRILLLLVPRVDDAWQLVFQLVSLFVTKPKININCFKLMFNSNLLRRVLSEAKSEVEICALAKYFVSMTFIFREKALDMAMMLTACQKPSPINLFWQCYLGIQSDTQSEVQGQVHSGITNGTSTAHTGRADDKSVLLHAVVLLYSCWLRVATDEEIMSSNTDLNLPFNEAVKLTELVRDECFKLFELDVRDDVALGGVYLPLLKLLRQMYARDSRVHFYSKDFWLGESILLSPQLGNVYLECAEDPYMERCDASSLYPDYLHYKPNSKVYGQSKREKMIKMYGLTGEEEEEDDPMGTGAGTNDDNQLIPIDQETYFHLYPSRELRILIHAPFTIKFENRVQFFYNSLENDRSDRFRQEFNKERVVINRERLCLDAEEAFRKLGPRIKNSMQVVMATEDDEEAGIDGGGLTRELLMELCDQIFANKFGVSHTTEYFTSENVPLFVELNDHTVLPNPVFVEDVSKRTPFLRSLYFFAGQVIGKCLYENLLIGTEFSSIFLSKWNRYNSSLLDFKDLQSLDSLLYQSVCKVMELKGKDVEMLGLDFTVMSSNTSGSDDAANTMNGSMSDSGSRLIELRPNGQLQLVTESNKHEFIFELAQYKLITCYKPQTNWFLEGLNQIIPLSWLDLFNSSEINKLISGGDREIDVSDLEAHTTYNGLTPTDELVKWFWEILQQFSNTQRRLLLKFVTSVPRGPLLGFGALNPPFSIHNLGPNSDLLPTSSTCMNIIRIPEYKTKKQLMEKLVYAIESNSGFDLQ